MSPANHNSSSDSNSSNSRNGASSFPSSSSPSASSSSSPPLHLNGSLDSIVPDGVNGSISPHSPFADAVADAAPESPPLVPSSSASSSPSPSLPLFSPDSLECLAESHMIQRMNAFPMMELEEIEVEEETQTGEREQQQEEQKEGQQDGKREQEEEEEEGEEEEEEEVMDPYRAYERHYREQQRLFFNRQHPHPLPPYPSHAYDLAMSSSSSSFSPSPPALEPYTVYGPQGVAIRYGTSFRDRRDEEEEEEEDEDEDEDDDEEEYDEDEDGSEEEDDDEEEEEDEEVDYRTEQMKADDELLKALEEDLTKVINQMRVVIPAFARYLGSSIGVQLLVSGLNAAGFKFHLTYRDW